MVKDPFEDRKVKRPRSVFTRNRMIDKTFEPHQRPQDTVVGGHLSNYALGSALNFKIKRECRHSSPKNNSGS